LESESTFKLQSDAVVESICNTPESSDIREFCNKINFHHEELRYHRSVLTYCNNVFPRPLQYSANIAHEYKLREIIARKFEEAKNSQIEIPFSDDSFGEYCRRMEESGRRLEIRFSEYEKSYQFIHELESSFSQHLKKFHLSRFNLSYANITKQKKSTRKSNKQPIILPPPKQTSVLCQCQFCYGYELRKKQNITAWDCKRDNCAAAYKRPLAKVSSDRLL
jgi:hypothetical protein